MPITEVDSPTSSRLLVHHGAASVSDPLHHYEQPPIRRLPLEVLREVFLPLGVCYKYLFCARMVCKYWAKVIDSTPELWTWVTNWLHPKLQAMIIRNSGNQLLEVEYTEWYWEEHPEKLAEYARLMKPTASRWHTLTYRQSRGSESNSWPLSLPLHNFERIEMKGLPTNYQRPTLDAPKLQYVDINYGSVNLRYLSGLRVLTLQSTDCTLNELTIVLRASPGLTELSLKQMYLDIGAEGLPNSYMNKIHLSQLHNLHISGAPARSGSFLLERIDAPSLELLNARVAFPTDAASQTQLCEAAGRQLGRFPLPKNQKTQVVIATRSWGIECGIGERRILIGDVTWVGADTRQAMPASIASLMRQLDRRTCEEVTSLKISCEYEDDCRECLRIVHLHFPRIVHLHFPRIDQILVDDEFQGMREIQVVPAIQHLSLPSQLGLTGEWLFPKLTKLRLYLPGPTTKDIGNGIVEVVKRRKEAEQTVEITELRIEVGSGEIDPRTVEILSQSVTRFEVVPIGGTSVGLFLFARASWI
ncbi:hypothetical protein FRC00_007571 [Tulasnella sp. 408]|nr:hypothetical protein FRC00_007571 [Tulasnella sp. 408]